MLTKKLQYNSHKIINSYNNVQFTTLMPNIQLFGKNKKQATVTTLPKEKIKKETEINATPISKYELSGDKLTFFVLSGVFKKRWVNRGEILLTEISHVESYGNLISITRGDNIYRYVYKNKTESFKALRDQILAYISEIQATAENNRKTATLKADLASAINVFIPTVDLCFDLLMAINKKRIEWSQIEAVTNKLSSNVSFAGQTIASLNVDLSKIILSVKSQVPKNIAKDTLDVLKTIYNYFDVLKPNDNLVKETENVDNAKKMILAYFTINDVLLAKSSGQKVEDKEISALENVVLTLKDKLTINLSLDELKAALSNFETGELGVNDVRAMFRLQPKQF